MECKGNLICNKEEIFKIMKSLAKYKMIKILRNWK